MSCLFDWENVCLVCLQKGENRFIFDLDNDSNVIADKIMKCAEIFIKRDTNHPKNICWPCLDDLNIAYKFRLKCEQSVSIIKALLNTNHQEFQIKDLWTTTPIAMNPIQDTCIKDEILDNAVVDDMCDNESTPMQSEKDIVAKDGFVVENKVDTCAQSITKYDVDNTPSLEDIETNFVIEDRAEACAQSKATELNYMEANERNKTKPEMNCGVTKRSRHRPKPPTDGSCAKLNLKSPYKKPLKVCKICNHSFRGQNPLDIHMRRHNNERPFSCDRCEKAFVTAADLRRHMRGHTGQKPYKCQYCHHRFAAASARKNHERTHTGERPYRCSTCGKSFRYSYGLSEHLRIHTGIKKYVCKECGKGFGRKVIFEKHLTNHKKLDELDKSPEHKKIKPVEKEIFRIEENANSNEINIKHEIVDTAVDDDTYGDDNTPCLDLGHDPVEVNNVKRSQNNKNKQEANCEISKRPRGRPKTLTLVSCANSKSAYRKPLKVCEICDHRFNSRHALANHMRRHYNERPFSCDYCDKSYVTNADLRRHLRVHSQKPYKCQYCDRRFAASSVRNDHQRTHTDDRPYVCLTCDKSFTYSYVLARHLRIHTGEKKYVCKECGKGFMKKAPFEKHIAVHMVRDELDKSSEHKDENRLEKEISQIEECVSSNEINIKHEMELFKEEIN